MTDKKYEQPDALFDEDFGDFDKTEANGLLDLRERFDTLSPAGRLAMAEALIRMDGNSLGLKGDYLLEDALEEYKKNELDKAEETSKASLSRCVLCEQTFEEGDVILDRQSVWVTPGSNQVQMREELGDRAHATCVKRVKEGGSAEAPLF